MPDLPALDVVIGLTFVYTVLALVCSTVNEAISTGVGLRARYLQKGLLNLLSGSSTTTDAGKATITAVYHHPLVQGLIRPAEPGTEVPDPTVLPKRWWQKPLFPSYVPSRTFVAALTDIAREAEGKVSELEGAEADEVEKRMKSAAEGLERSLAAIPNKELSEALVSLCRAAENNAASFNRAAERWFDDSMERVSGWYKRRVQLILFGLAVIVVVVLNADTFAAGRVLWRDDAVRSAVVQQAEAAAASTTDDIDVDQAVSDLQLPLGWQLSFGDGATELPERRGGLAREAPRARDHGRRDHAGRAVLVRPAEQVRAGLRGAGAPPPATDAVRKGEGEQPRAGPGAAPLDA